MSITANRVLVATARLLDDYAALQALLQADGIDVDRAENFAQVTNLVSERRYALALVDADLPGVSGAELCCQLVDRPRPTVPVIMRLSPSAGRIRCLTP